MARKLAMSPDARFVLLGGVAAFLGLAGALFMPPLLPAAAVLGVTSIALAIPSVLHKAYYARVSPAWNNEFKKLYRALGSKRNARSFLSKHRASFNLAGLGALGVVGGASLMALAVFFPAFVATFIPVMWFGGFAIAAMGTGFIMTTLLWSPKLRPAAILIAGGVLAAASTFVIPGVLPIAATIALLTAGCGLSLISLFDAAKESGTALIRMSPRFDASTVAHTYQTANKTRKEVTAYARLFADGKHGSDVENGDDFGFGVDFSSTSSTSSHS